MDYEKKYKEALERARKLINEDGIVLGSYPNRKACEAIFPELVESEDERIRKELIDHFHQGIKQRTTVVNKESYERWLSWLEKQKKPENVSASTMIPSCWETEQKEQKPINWTELTWKDIVELEGIINNVHYDFSAGIGQESFGKEVLERFRSSKGVEYLDESERKCWEEQKPRKFKVGDIVTNGEYTYTIDYIDSDRYWLKERDCATIPFEHEDNWQVVEQQPITEIEDALANELQKIISDWQQTGANPYDSVSALMGDVDAILAIVKKEQKPAEWSEEDEKMLDHIEEMVNFCYCNHFVVDAETSNRVRKWLWARKSWPKREWDEVDRKNIETLITALPKCTFRHPHILERDECRDLIVWLKSLRPS